MSLSRGSGWCPRLALMVQGRGMVGSVVRVDTPHDTPTIMLAISAPPGTGWALSVMLDVVAPLPLAPERSALRPGEADKTVMGASRTGSYQVTPPGRARVGDATAREPTSPGRDSQRRVSRRRVTPRKAAPPTSSISLSTGCRTAPDVEARTGAGRAIGVQPSRARAGERMYAAACSNAGQRRGSGSRAAFKAGAHTSCGLCHVPLSLFHPRYAAAVPEPTGNGADIDATGDQLCGRVVLELVQVHVPPESRTHAHVPLRRRVGLGPHAAVRLG
jgi:hypothetical protein